MNSKTKTVLVTGGSGYVVELALKDIKIIMSEYLFGRPISNHAE